MLNDIYKIRKEILNLGHKNIKIRSIKINESTAWGKPVFKLKYEITYIDSSSDKRKRWSSPKETFSNLAEAEQRSSELKLISSGHDNLLAKKNTTTEEKTIKEYCDEYRLIKLNDLIENRHHPENSAIRHTETTQNKNHSDALLGFLHERGIEYFSQIEDNPAIFGGLNVNNSRLPGYKEHLLASKATYWNGEEIIEKDNTLSVQTVRKRIAFVHQVIKFIKSRPNSPIKRDLYELPTISTKEKSLLDGKISERKIDNTRKLTEDEIRALFYSFSTTWIVPFAFSIHTGCRMGKTLNLLREEVDLENDVLNLVGYKEIKFKGKTYICRQKNSKSLSLPLNNELKNILEIHFRWLDSLKIDSPFAFPVTDDSINRKTIIGSPRRNNFLRAVKCAAKRAFTDKDNLPDYEIIKGINVKCFRKTKGTEIYENAISEAILFSRDILGHSDEKVTRNHYIAKSKKFIEVLRKEIDKIKYNFDLNYLSDAYKLTNHGVFEKKQNQRNEETYTPKKYRKSNKDEI